MAGLIDSAAYILASSERRIEAAARNVSNASTPGYKTQVAFTQLLDRASEPDAAAPQLQLVTRFSQGKFVETGKPFDLAILGNGLFKLREGDAFVYSRGGSFSIGANGAVTDASGRVLQQAGGGDVVVDDPTPDILGDGTIIQRGLPIAQIGVFDTGPDRQLTALGGGLFRTTANAVEAASESTVKQGQLESSSVVMSDEMISMMTAIRQAESGARLVRFYDQLLGQAINTFSRSGQ